MVRSLSSSPPPLAGGGASEIAIEPGGTSPSILREAARPRVAPGHGKRERR